MSTSSDLYEQDFYAWTQRQATLLKTGRLSELDVAHLTEELESMGRSEWHELVDRLAVLLAHLLKWRCQPERRGNSWRLTIEEQRRRIARRLNKSPSLKHDSDEALAEAYADAVLKAAKETGIDRQAFPDRCPFTLEQILDAAFWPDG